MILFLAFSVVTAQPGVNALRFVSVLELPLGSGFLGVEMSVKRSQLRDIYVLGEIVAAGCLLLIAAVSQDLRYAALILLQQSRINVCARLRRHGGMDSAG